MADIRIFRVKEISEVSEQYFQEGGETDAFYSMTMSFKTDKGEDSITLFSEMSLIYQLERLAKKCANP